MCEQNKTQNDKATLARKTAHMGRLLHRYYGANSAHHGAAGNPLRGQGRILALLTAKPQITQRELSFLLDMRQQSLSELLAKLEEKGYVTREKSAEDGRVTVVTLTDAGRDAAPSPEEMDRRADAFDCLTDEERAQFELYVDKVSASLEEKLTKMGIDPNAPRPRPHAPRGPQGPGMHGPHGPEFGPEEFGRPDCGPHKHRGPFRSHEGDEGAPHHGPYRPESGHNDHGMRRASHRPGEE